MKREGAGPPLIAVVGPTAVGKTRLAVALARRFQGEIINADSRQVYRYLDIGAAKPTPEEQRQATHHLIDVVDPDQDFGLGLFLSLAKGKISEISGRGSVPILAGGSGQYVWAILEGWDVPQAPPDPAFRSAKEREAADRGPLALYRELEKIDPRRAEQLDPRNVRRVIRALEIFHVSGRVPSDYRKGTGEAPESLVLGLTLSRPDLYDRIDRRVDLMIESGLIEEAQRLAGMGYRIGEGPLASPGYLEIGRYLAGELNLAEAAQRAKFRTHRLARKQYGWFRKDDPRVHWFDASDPQLDDQASRLVADFLSGPPPCDTIIPQSTGRPSDEVH